MDCKLAEAEGKEIQKNVINSADGSKRDMNQRQRIVTETQNGVVKITSIITVTRINAKRLNSPLNRQII